MGDPQYPYPVALHWTDDPESLRKLKNKLLLYFQKRSESNGGECEIRDINCSRGHILIHFKEEAARDRVLHKDLHVLKVSRGMKMRLDVGSVRTDNDGSPEGSSVDPRTDLPPQPAADAPAQHVPQEPQTSLLLIESIQDSFKSEMLNLLLENISGKNESTDFHVERIPENQCAVITFTCDIDIMKFVETFSSHSRIQTLKMTAKLLEESRWIRVEGLLPDTPEDYITLYFESSKCGGPQSIEDILVIPEERAAHVTFTTIEAAKNVLARKHQFAKKDVCVFPYYPSQDIVLYGKQRPQIQKPEPLTFPVSPYILEFILSDAQQKDHMEKTMGAHTCEIKWPDLLSPNPEITLNFPDTLSTHLRTLARLVPTWNDTVHAEFSRLISRYKVVEYKINQSVWDAIKEHTSGPKYNQVLIKPDKAAEKVFLAGVSMEVDKTDPIFRQLVEETTKQVERKTQTRTETLSMSPALYQIMCNSGLQKNILDQVPELKINYDVSRKEIHLSGVKDEVLTAKCEILNLQIQLESKTTQEKPQLTPFLVSINEDLSNLASGSQSGRDEDGSSEDKAWKRVRQKSSHEIVLSDQTKIKLQVFRPAEPMGSYSSSHDGSNDRRASGSSEDADHQEHNRGRKNDSQRDFSSKDDDPKRLKDNPTGSKPWENGANFGGNMLLSGPASWVGHELQSSMDFTTFNEGVRNSLSHMSTEERVERRPGDLPEIFSKLKGTLDKKLFNRDLQQEIKAKFPSLIMKEDQEFVEVSGTFDEIKRLGQYVLRKLTAEKPSDTPSSGAAGNAEDFSATDNREHEVCFASALYDYIMEIYRSDVEDILRRNRVRIDHRSSQEGSTYVTFIPQGPQASPEIAKESFKDKVQKVLGDWNQKKVDPSDVPLMFPDIKQRLKDRWSNIQVIQDGNMDILLRGPTDELSQAIQSLKKENYKPACPGGGLTITFGDMRTEIPVDARHMDILKKLKSRDISDIEKKYNVKMDEQRKNGSVIVTFRAIDVTSDLSPHASHSFTTLLQKTLFDIEKKVIAVNPEFKEEKVAILQEDLMMRGVDLVMEYTQGSVVLIGHPNHVAFATEMIIGMQNPGRDQAAASSKKPIDTNDSSAAQQPKAEEPDTCPVCLCEIKDKVTLEKCKHAYCKGCLKDLMSHKPVCAICGVVYGAIKGDQPDGTMTHKTTSIHLPGFSDRGTIEINYSIPGGTQKDNHPHPGRYFSGTVRTAYLPDNAEGRDILKLLKKAFDQRLIFTVGESRTTGATDTVIWNNIHHKTNIHGGPQGFGYPDPDYLKRVREELKAKGIE